MLTQFNKILKYTALIIRWCNLILALYFTIYRVTKLRANDVQYMSFSIYRAFQNVLRECKYL
jgi:hypothetical protein